MPDSTHKTFRWSLDAIAEIGAAIALSAAALLTSWAGFQAALWDGEQAAAYAQAGIARVQAGVLATQNGQLEAVDLFLFTQWLNAFAEEDQELQDFYRVRFRPEFARAFDAWVALKPRYNPTAPPTPFAMPNYKPVLARQSAETNQRADALFAKGERANSVGDSFVRATVVLAIALFLGGIGQTFKREILRLGLSGLAAIACVAGLIQLFALPVASL